MFSIHDIDGQVEVFKTAAAQLYERADDPGTPTLLTALLRCHADGLREAARSLESMTERAIEREARELMR